MEKRLYKLTQLAGKVETVLKAHPGARDDDRVLFTELIKEYYPQCVHFTEAVGGRMYVDLEDMHILPSQETVARARRNIQNKHHMYLPISPDVARKRLDSEAVMQFYYGKA